MLEHLMEIWVLFHLKNASLVSLDTLVRIMVQEQSLLLLVQLDIGAQNTIKPLVLKMIPKNVQSTLIPHNKSSSLWRCAHTVQPDTTVTLLLFLNINYTLATQDISVFQTH